MADFQIAFRKIIIVEGGYTNDVLDHGGETKYGISKRSYPNVDIRNLTLSDASMIYKRDYWDECQLDYIHDQRIAEEVFDTAVNCGIGTASRFLQTALNLVCWETTKLVVDGDIGQKTIQAFNKCTKYLLVYKVLNGLQFEKYHLIVKNNPSQLKWFRGWMKRVWEDYYEVH